MGFSVNHVDTAKTVLLKCHSLFPHVVSLTIHILVMHFILGPRADFHCSHVATWPHQQATSWGIGLLFRYYDRGKKGIPNFFVSGQKTQEISS